MAKWAKKDIKVLQQCIDSFWLYNRPLSDSHSDYQQALAAVRQHLDKHRAEIVCGGIAELGGIASERAQKNQEAADHFAEHPEVYGKSAPEMIERFSRFAEEDRKDVKRAQMLIARVQTEGLPPEVMSHDPVTGSGR